MRNRRLISVLAIAFFASTPALAGDCISKLKLEKGVIKDIIDCLAVVEQENKTLREKIVNLEKIGGESKNLIARLVDRQSIPAGAVVAFDLQRGCPSGWKQVDSKWIGRSIVVADSDRTKKYGYGVPGGKETHTLSVEEIPKHQHQNPAKYVFLQKRRDKTFDLSSLPIRDVDKAKFTDMGRSDQNKNNITKFTGGGAPHNNMPPYIPLYYCEKE